MIPLSCTEPHPSINASAKLWWPWSRAQRVRGLVPTRPLELRGSPGLRVTRPEPGAAALPSGGEITTPVMSTGRLLCLDTQEFIKPKLTTPWLPWWPGEKQSACQCRRPGWGRPPEGRNGNPLQYPCLGNPMERSPAGYSPCGHQESDTTQQLSDHDTKYESKKNKMNINH